MAGIVNVPKFVDFRDKVKRHPSRKFPVLSLRGKTTIAIHHSLTKRGLGGSNAEGYARYHVDTHGWPSIGYNYVIEPDGTIKFCNELELRTYHVGNHNNYAIGIVLTGDFRYEDPTPEQEESLRNLVSALQKEYTHLKHIKGHSEFSGYEWKQCPVFDYKAVLNQKGSTPKPETTPGKYTIQEGDTFWSIAKGESFTADDIQNVNKGVDPRKLKVGQTINLPGDTSNPTPKPKKSINQLAQEVIDGKHGTGSERKKSLGDQYEAVQKRVNEILLGGTPKPRKKSIATMAQEVIDGKHGTGHANRRRSLGISQSEYEKVRAEVNKRAGGSSPSRKSISQMASEVIAGKHGNGHANRRKSLGISQSEYEKVRAEVNRRS